jgi:hypothetical protein
MVVSFSEAVTPEGKTTPQMLAYFITERGKPFSPHDIISSISVNECHVYDLTQQEDRFATWLLESEFESMETFSGACATVLYKAFTFHGMIRCALMFDGAYGGPDSTIDCAMAGYIYGLRTKRNGSVLCMDVDTLRSSAWHELISLVSQRR